VTAPPVEDGIHADTNSALVGGREVCGDGAGVGVGFEAGRTVALGMVVERAGVGSDSLRRFVRSAEGAAVWVWGRREAVSRGCG